MKAKITSYSIPLLILTIIITFCSFSCSTQGPAEQTIEEPAQETTEEITVEEPEEEPAEEVVADEPVEEEVAGEPEEALNEPEEEETAEEAEEETLVEEDDNNGNTEIKYEIIYTLNFRLDGAITYYVLIDPIDLSDVSFKDNIKEIIRKIVEEKGKKISIEIFDKRDSLENGYKDGKFDAMADLKNLKEWENWFTDEIINDLAIHSIATYDGELENYFYLNTLSFFTYSDYVENTVVDKYAETIEFNPYVEEQVTNSEDEKEQEDSSSLLEQIKISGEIQDIYNDELKIVIWVKNESNKTFSGYIMIEFYDNKNEIIWQDWSSSTWDFKAEVPPGKSNYCIMWIPLEKGYPVNIRSRVKDYKFY